MEIVHVKPGNYFVFIGSVDAFHDLWRESQRRGEMMDVLACTDQRSLNWGTPIGDLPLPRRVRLNPATIESGELFTEQSSWRGEDVGAVYRDLMAAWEASRPPNEQQAKALADQRRLEKAQRGELRTAEDLERRLLKLASELREREFPTVELHRVGNPPVLDVWLIRTWEERLSSGEMVGYTPAPTVVTRRGLALAGDGVLIGVRIVAVTKENGPLRRLRFKLWAPPSHCPAPEKVVGERWGSPSAYGLASLASPLVRAEVLKDISAFCREHELRTDFKTPLSSQPGPAAATAD